MSSDSHLAGQLRIDLNWHDGQIRSVTPTLNRPLAKISQWLRTMPPELACEQVSSVFALCGQSHALAAKLAHGLVQPDGRETRRLLQNVQLENWREGVIRMVEYWNYPASDDEVLDLIKTLMRCSAMDEPDVSVLQEVWNNWLTAEREQHWKNRLKADLGERYGHLDIKLDSRPLDEWLQNQADALMDDTKGRAESVLAMSSGWINPHGLCRVADSEPGSGTGLGEVRTSRGWLSHHCDDIQWQITAPTDRHFGPYGESGWLNQQLTGVSLSCDEAVSITTRIVQAMNPCVAFRVVLVGDGGKERGSIHA